MYETQEKIVIEERGIIMGVMYYLLKNLGDMIGKRIVIEDDRVRKLLEYLFYDLRFKKHGDGVVFNIKNNNRNGIVINNVGNLPSVIHAKRVHYLLWFNKDNPLVMYEVDERKNVSLDNVRRNFEEMYRLLRVGGQLFEWNISLDNKILGKFVKRYMVFGDVGRLSNFVACYVNNFLNCEKEVLMVPYLLEVPKVKDNYVVVPIFRDEKKVVECKKDESDNVNKLVGHLSNKFEILNNIVDKK